MPGHSHVISVNGICSFPVMWHSHISSNCMMGLGILIYYIIFIYNGDLGLMLFSLLLAMFSCLNAAFLWGSTRCIDMTLVCFVIVGLDPLELLGYGGSVSGFRDWTAKNIIDSTSGLADILGFSEEYILVPEPPRLERFRSLALLYVNRVSKIVWVRPCPCDFPIIGSGPRLCLPHHVSRGWCWLTSSTEFHGTDNF